MTLNGKSGNFTMNNFRACAKTTGRHADRQAIPPTLNQALVRDVPPTTYAEMSFAQQLT